jgi:arginyl-tRNA synthetase
LEIGLGYNWGFSHAPAPHLPRICQLVPPGGADYMLPAVKKDIVAALKAALHQALGAQTPADPVITLERPKVAAHGDLACNIAMQLAKPLKKNPRELAQGIVAALMADPGARQVIDSAEIAGPGFINFRIPAPAKQRVVAEVLGQAEKFGRSDAGGGQRLLVEFVSANPTGPLHVGHGRQGALGDALCGLFESQGYAVTREFYYNDAGVQIANLALSVQARCRGLAPGEADWPESAYNGEYIADIAADFLAKKSVCAADMEVAASGNPEDLESIRKFAVAYLRREQDLDLQVFGVRFDNYYLESSLYEDGKVEATVAALVAAGKTYELDGALWLKTTDYGDDKDRVMRKSDGSYTYFVPDVAYHIAKWQRGFTRAINVQGSDHHGTIARVRAGLQAVNLGIPKGYPDYVLHKMVTVMKGGEEVKISKRAGSYVTLRDLIEMSGDGDGVRGRDAVRFFLISRKADTEFVFDVDLALKTTDENPVYYVQYAHARICSVLREWDGDRAVLAGADLGALTHVRELGLMQKLAELPDMLATAATDLAPHDLTFYVRELAGDFHALYNERELRVLAAPDTVKMARLALYAATAQAIRNVLALLGVSAPEQM